MQLTVNGETRRFPSPPTLSQLLEKLGATPERVAVMVNGEVIPRGERDRLQLREDDRVEVLGFCGGG